MACSCNPLAVSLIVCFITICSISWVEASDYGVTVELIHPDSPRSPMYNPSETDFDRVRKSVKRSLDRFNSLKSVVTRSPDAVGDPLRQSGGGYLMNVGIGTPPQKVWAIADTGSDLAWTQCAPCSQCFKQNDPLYDPRKSSTFRQVPCSGNQCTTFGGEGCDGQGKGCVYRVSYGDQSFSAGLLSTETLTFDSATSGEPKALPNVAFGCGRSNDGTFDSSTSGIIGLGGGPVSIVQQLGRTVAGRFSYCLTPYNSNATSRISFGSDAVVRGSNVLSTPIVKKATDTFYYLTLKGITVGNQSLSLNSINPNQAGEEGNVIIDSGTTMTYLPSDLYNSVVSALEQGVQGTRVDDPAGTFPLCYRLPAGGKLRAPPVTANFEGANVVLPPEGLFIEVSQGVACATFLETTTLGLAIFGNLHQINYLVGYDLGSRTVNFLRTDCSRSQ